MPDIDVVDSTWLGVTPATVAPALADPLAWRRWWPDLVLRVDELRGPKGVRWSVPSAREGRLAGSMEVWLQGVDDGTVAHYFLRLDAVGARLRSRARQRLVHHYRLRAKAVFWQLGGRLDPGRLARVSAPRGRL